MRRKRLDWFTRLVGSDQWNGELLAPAPGQWEVRVTLGARQFVSQQFDSREEAERVFAELRRRATGEARRLQEVDRDDEQVTAIRARLSRRKNR